MIKLISISSDRNIFKEGSAVRARQVEYASLFDEMHIVIFAKYGSFPKKVQIAPNAWVYSTNSISKFLYVRNAQKIAAGAIVQNKCSAEDSVITAQDPFETGLVGLRLKGKFKLPIHVQIHTDFLNPYFAKQSFLNRLRVRIAKKVLPQADAVRVVSQRIMNSLSAISLKTGVVPTVLPIFVDIKKIEDTPISDGLDLRKKYPQFNFIVLVASRLTPEKNISFAITAFSRVSAVYPKIGLVIVGEGEEKKKLQSLAKSLNIENKVVFEPWQNDLTSFYKTAHLFLLTSNFEGYGLTLVEAIASGCPVVSTDVGVAPEILKSDTESYVCPVGDVDCFFTKMTALVGNPGLRERYVYDASARLEQLLVLYKKDYFDQYQKNIESALKMTSASI